MLRRWTLDARYQRQLVMADDGGTIGLDYYRGADVAASFPVGAPVLLVLHGVTGEQLCPLAEESAILAMLTCQPAPWQHLMLHILQTSFVIRSWAPQIRSDMRILGCMPRILFPSKSAPRAQTSASDM